MVSWSPEAFLHTDNENFKGKNPGIVNQKMKSSS